MNKIKAFPPFAQPDATRLILGSMPGIESLRRGEYYGHPRNYFWKIMGEVLHFDYHLSYAGRIEILQKHHIALWDTVRCCVRPGSMDADIRHAEPNDFASFFERHDKIRKVFFNGQTSRRLFLKHCRAMDLPELELILLPSTSPANASVKYSAKLEAWQQLAENN